MEKFISGYPVFLLMLARVIGFVALNPVFGRKNLPAPVKMGICGAFALAAFWRVNLDNFEFSGDLFAFILKFCLELFFGFALSFVIDVLLSALVFGGELFDMQMGLSMNKFYDATTGSEMPTTGALIRVMFMLVFFLTNSHHNLFKIIHSSYYTLPAGEALIGPSACFFIVELMKNVFELSLKLAMPMFAAVLVMDVGIGILMRTIPQLNVFVLNIYVKFLIGFLLLLKLSPGLVEFSKQLTGVLFVNIERLIKIAAG